jgi:hypothetical protein
MPTWAALHCESVGLAYEGSNPSPATPRFRWCPVVFDSVRPSTGVRGRYAVAIMNRGPGGRSRSADHDNIMVSEFGEEIHLRPGGCPSCGADFITVYADHCWRCEAEFPPAQRIGIAAEDPVDNA